MAALNCNKWLKTVAILGTTALAAAGCGGGGPTDPAPSAAQDTMPPQITEIQGIKDGDVILTSVVLGATAVDDTAVANFKLLINEQTVVDAALDHIVYSWDVRGSKSGSYVLSFIASDAAGNSATQKVNVIVGAAASGPHPAPASEETPGSKDNTEPDPMTVPLPDAGEGEGPVLPPPPVTEVESNPVEGTGFILPSMDPALFNPNDSQSPKLVITGLADNAVVWGTWHISVITSDDTGVNVITLLIDNSQLALREASGLDYLWNTEEYVNGAHMVTIVVRDNGGNVCRCDLNVIVDNASDHDGPVIDPVTGTTWSIYGLTGEPLHADSWDYRWGIAGAGDIHLHIAAADPSGVAKVELQQFFSHELVAAAAGDALDYTWECQADSPYGHESYRISATDSLGNTSIATLWLESHNMTELSGYLRAANGAIVENLTVSIRPGHYESVAEAAEAPIMKVLSSYDVQRKVVTCSDVNGWFILEDASGYTSQLSCGLHTLFVESNESAFQAMFPMVFEPEQPYFLELADAFVFPATGGNPQPNCRVAVVSGSEDDAMSAFDVLSTTDCHYFVDAEAGIPEDIVQIDGDDTLPDSALDFMDFITNAAELYKYRCILIESGNLHEQEWAANEQAVDALRTWVADGGQLLLTNHAYDFCEQMFPDKFDFAGDDKLNGLGPVPEGLDLAQQGGPVEFMYVSSNEYYWNHRYANYWSQLQEILSGLGASDDDLVPPLGWTVIERMAIPEDILCRGRDASVEQGQPHPFVTLAAQVSYGQGRVIVTAFPLAQAEYSPKLVAALFMDMALFSH